MSKLVTQRFEYVNYDDATQVVAGSGVIAAYPVATDTYQNNATSSASTSYGSANVTCGGSTPVSVSVPVGATLTMIGASTNGVHIMATLNNVALVPGGATQSLVFFPVAPNQIVTLPGVLNPGTLSFQGGNQNLAQLTDTASVQLLWSV